MDRRRTFATWICVGAAAGAFTVSAIGLLFVLGGALRSGSVSVEDLVVAGFAVALGAIWGGLGGAVAGVVGAAVSRALAARGREGPAVEAAIAAGVVAAIAVPFWALSYSTTSTSEAVGVVVVPLVVAVASAWCTGQLIWRIRSGDPLWRTSTSV